MIGRMFYAIRQGFKNIGRNRLFSLASVGTITACLFLFGIFYCIVANFQYMVHAAESNVGVTVFFDETVTEDKMLEIQRLIDAREEVSSTNYISADDAWENFKQDYFADGDEGILAGLDQDNPLVDCASVQVYLADTSRQAELISYIESLEGVSEVNASDIIADSFTNFSRLIGYVSLGIILILVFVAIFLISNTVMIGIAVRKEEIAIMKYIGATDLFVRGPFIVEGMTIGLIGSVIPVAILRALYPMVVDFVLEHFSILNRILTFMNVNDVFNILIPISLAIGLGIGFIGSYMTLRKHVRV
ncbi:MAG TPA: ABC transporter permease [Lachnospiraceae bacterium]|jgi:cell division transport system permease protein|nr:ABC transporter permease [Lachnospiraceae bacterium]